MPMAHHQQHIPPPSSTGYPSRPYQSQVPLPPSNGNNPYNANPYMGAAALPAQQGGQVRANGSRLTGDPKEDYPIVMAIDFGTTFTGCAFAFRKDPEIQEIITW